MPQLSDAAIRAAKPRDQRFTLWDETLKGFGVRVFPGGAKTFIVLIGAAAWLAGNSDNSSRDKSPKGTVPRTEEERGLTPLELEHDHVAVEALGFSAEDAAALGIGYANRGIMRGHVAVPIRLEDGTLAGYIGITEAKLPPRWHGIPSRVVVPIRKPA